MALGWFLRAMLSQIVDPTNINSPKYYNSKTESTEFITIPNKSNKSKSSSCEGFQMPLHYPRYKKEDYEKMEAERIDQLLREYGLAVNGSPEEKQDFAMGAFLWPGQM